MTDQRSLGFWVQLVDRLLAERFAATIEEHGVTERQWQLLSLLSRGPATTADLDSAVAPFPATDANGETAAEHLTELIDSAWVAATTTGYELTERGSTAFERLHEVLEANRELASEGISAADQATTSAALERMAANLGWRAEG